MNIQEILVGYKKAGISPATAAREQVALYTARALAQSAIRKAGCTIHVSDDGTYVNGGDWFALDPDLDVAFQTALEKISSTGKGR